MPVRKIIKQPTTIAKKPGIKDIQKRRITQLEKICEKHGTTTQKIPAWLLKKHPKRLEYWFKHGE